MKVGCGEYQRGGTRQARGRVRWHMDALGKPRLPWLENLASVEQPTFLFSLMVATTVLVPVHLRHGQFAGDDFKAQLRMGR